VIEECEEVGSGIHGMNDDVSISITDDDDECISRRLFVGIEVEL
jgi:hypothetical protein